MPHTYLSIEGSMILNRGLSVSSLHRNPREVVPTSICVGAWVRVYVCNCVYAFVSHTQDISGIFSFAHIVCP
jgi:hypothetical protein